MSGEIEHMVSPRFQLSSIAEHNSSPVVVSVESKEVSFFIFFFLFFFIFFFYSFFFSTQATATEKEVITEVIKRGWMMKRGGNVKNWKKRYFILYNNNLIKFVSSPLRHFRIISFNLFFPPKVLHWRRSIKAKGRVQYSNGDFDIARKCFFPFFFLLLFLFDYFDDFFFLRKQVDGKKDCILVHLPHRVFVFKNDSDVTITLQWYALVEHQFKPQKSS